MFQSFDNGAAPADTREHLPQLRQLLRKSNLDGFLVPHADEHQNEYLPRAAERLAWLTGFTGSAGSAVVLAKEAALFVDGRYILQAPGEVDTGLFEILQVPKARPSRWLSGKLPAGAVVGFDPWLHTVSQIEALHGALKKKGIKLKPLARNPIDRLWGRARPAKPRAGITVHPMKYAGKSAEAKIAALQDILKDDGQQAAILTQTDSIAWLFNIRGGDIAHNPVALAFAIVPRRGKPDLFVDAQKIGPEAAAHLKAIAKIRKPVDLAGKVDELRRAKRHVRLDPASAAWWFERKLGGGLGRPAKLVKRAKDPCLDPKSIKNAAEVRGARKAHIRDGAAMVRFLDWLGGAAASGDVDEISAARRLEALRAKSGALREISFDTISGAGPNGAIVHYRVSEASNRKLKPGELYLVDSGAQYLDGTTDITRTIAIGNPTAQMRQHFTLVLKGHIAIALVRFPRGTRGIDLDAFARRALWEHGFDYAHGTGHGVGSYLSVHEGPQSISRNAMAALAPGMIISNEPGYYRRGAYGIRIENLVLVKPLEKIAGGELKMMSFETLTLAPIDLALVEPDLMSAAELGWLNDYHGRVRTTLGPSLDKAERRWLEAATRAIG